MRLYDVDHQGQVWRKNTFNVSHILGVIMLFYNALFNTRGEQHGFHVKWCPCPITVTRRVSLVVLKLLTLLDDVSSPGIKWGCIVKSLVFCVVFCRPLFVRLFFPFSHCLVYPFSMLSLFVLFHLAIVLSVLRYYHCLSHFIHYSVSPSISGFFGFLQILTIRSY